MERATSVKFVPKRLDGHRLTLTIRDLNERLADCHTVSGKRGNADHAFSANGRYLDHASVVHHAGD
jgi:hypothetical protein